MKFIGINGSESTLSGHYEIDGGKFSMEFGGSKFPKLRFISDKEGSEFGIRFNLPETDSPKIDLSFKKQQRNHICTCGSGKKYKNCCAKNEISYILDLFKTKSPVACQISDELYKIIRLSNVYNMTGYNNCLGNCINFLNKITGNEFEEMISKLLE